MTTEEIALSEARLRDLLALALKATPGQWEYRHDDEVWTQSDRFLASAVIDDDAAFIAAANADTIRSLVTELLALREAAAGALTHRVGDLPGRGWLADNPESRRALAVLARALSHPEPMK